MVTSANRLHTVRELRLAEAAEKQQARNDRARHVPDQGISKTAGSFDSPHPILDGELGQFTYVPDHVSVQAGVRENISHKGKAKASLTKGSGGSGSSSVRIFTSAS